MGQLALSAAGAVVGGVAGFFVGGPSGAMYGAELGWMAGGIAGGMIFRQKGPSPADIRIQDSAYGKPVPFVYGVYRIAGNIIWAGQPYVSNAGKGSKGPTQTKVAMSFAIGLCAGPITGVRRIWANGKLIYDVSDPSNFQAISGSNQMTTNFTVYPGDELQMPDPIMQAALGIANTPAYRGLAYVVFNDLDLSTWGNYLPSFSFEVITAPAALATSNTAATYNYTTVDGSVMQAPCLNAQGGIAMGFGTFFGYAGVSVANLTAYGAAQTNVLQPVGFNGGLGVPVGYSDVPGILGSNMWLDPVGTSISLSAMSGVDLGLAGSGANFNRSGTDLFLATTYPGARPIWRCDLTQAGLVVATTTVQDEWLIIGSSRTYLYAIATGSNLLYRLNRSTLAAVQSWSQNWANGAIQTGYVYDDDHIYIQGADKIVRLFRPSQNTITAIGTGPFAAYTMVAVNQNFFVFANGGYVNSISLGYMWVSQGQTFTTVGAAVADICNRAGLSPSQYDVSQLTDQLSGYSVTNHSPARSNLGPLMSAFFFDACDSDGLIKFVRRGAQPVGTFLYADLGASASIGDDLNNNPITEVIGQEIDLPRSVQFSYSELGDDYNPNTQRAQRAFTNSNKDLVLQAPIVFAGSDALSRTQSMLWSAWVGRKTFRFSTGLQYLAYEPGDVMTLQGASESYIVRITRCQYDGQGSLIWDASLEEPDIYPNASYTTQGATAAGFRTQQIDYSGPSILAVLDVPPLRDADTSQGLYIAACGMSSQWPGCAVDISRDGSTYSQLANVSTPATMGTTQSALPNFGGGNQPDELSTVSVVLYEGSLASVSYSDFLNGLNAAYIGGEIVYFRSATMTAANTYTLSGFLRGRGGTESAMSAHQSGEQFVLLNASTLAVLPINLTDIGSALYFEPFLLNIFGSVNGAVTQLTPANARVRPLSPALFVAGHGSAASVSDISLSWYRRARVKAQWLDGTDVPLDESSENYTLKIYNGSTLVRTTAIAGNGTGGTYVYAAASITADGFSTGNAITFTVQQNSDQGVLGAPATATINR